MRQGFAWWSFTHGREVEPPTLLRQAVAAGAMGVEMLPEPLWPVARDLGLVLPTISGHALEKGFNDPSRHTALADEVRWKIDAAAAGGVEAVIVFAGSRIGDGADGPAITACVEGLQPVVDHAGQAGVRLLLELLNSKVDHPGHQCDRTAFGAEVVRQCGAPGFRLLYDAYHMQLMEGNLIHTITTHFDLIGHIHTGGAPGRRDLDDRQEVNWSAIAGALHRLGYQHWIGHEFVPRGDPMTALRHANALFAPANP